MTEEDPGTQPPPPEPAAPALTGRQRAVRWAAGALLTVLMGTVYFFLPLDNFGPHHPVLSWIILTAALTLVATLLMAQIRNVLLDRPGTLPGLSIILLMCLSVLVFSATYYALAKQAGAFDGLTTRLDALFFTVVTLATVGYGDITPHGQTARAITLLQIVYSFVFLTAAATALTSRLRAQLLRHQLEDPPRPEAGPETEAPPRHEPRTHPRPHTTDHPHTPENRPPHPSEDPPQNGP